MPLLDDLFPENTILSQTASYLSNLITIQPFKFFFGFFMKLYVLFIVIPLFYFWQYGPGYGKFGGMGGDPPEVICSRIQGMSPAFWEANMKECYQIVAKNFSEVLSLVSVFIYVFLLKIITEKIFSFFVEKIKQILTTRDRQQQRRTIRSSTE